MTLCTKQFDPLKKCRKREGTEVAHINIDLKDEKPISAYRSGDYHILGAHFPCGHYWPSHLDAPQDLLNVEEERNEIKELEGLKEEIKKISQLSLWFIVSHDSPNFDQVEPFVEQLKKIIEMANQ